MSIRPATHAGSWYISNPDMLSTQLSDFLNKADESVVKGTRVLISPHAGYTYCGRTMAKCYAKLDITHKTKRIFILGPSHHFYFKNKALLSRYSAVGTPLGDLQVDQEVITRLLQFSDIFGSIDVNCDKYEHSLEMQFPMIYKTIEKSGREPSSIKLIPILVSHNSPEVDLKIGKHLKGFLDDESNIIIVSSDFCHWGRRFDYTGYVNSVEDITQAISEATRIESLTDRCKMKHNNLKIYESIELLDKYAMEILSQPSKSKNSYQRWKEYLEITGNTICGEKPIGILLSAFNGFDECPSFSWAGYSQSNHANNLDDSSVSYAAGYCQL